LYWGKIKGIRAHTNVAHLKRGLKWAASGRRRMWAEICIGEVVVAIGPESGEVWGKGYCEFPVPVPLVRDMGSRGKY